MKPKKTKTPAPSLPKDVIMQFYQMGRRDALKSMIDVMEMPQLRDSAFTTKQIVEMLKQAQNAPAPVVDPPKLLTV